MKSKNLILGTVVLKLINIRRVCVIGILFPLLVMQVGCINLGGIESVLRQTNVELRNTVDTFDRAIDALARQSSDWQVVLQDLEQALVDDVQSTLRVEVTNLLETGILSVGGEFRCDAEFLRTCVERKLRKIRNDLAQALNNAGITPPIPLLTVEPVEPVICSAAPGAVNLTLDAERRTILDVYGFDLRSLPITAEVVGINERRNVTKSLGIISDLRMVLDITDTGAQLKESSRKIVFSWGGEPQSVIPIVSPTVTERCDISINLVTGDPQTFIPPHVGGDREYDGHGPCVIFDLKVKSDVEGKKLTADYYMKAYECNDDFNDPRSDHTTAEGSGTVELFSVTLPGERILGHNLASSAEDKWIDDTHESETRYFAGNKPVEKLICVGDTKGDEAGTETGCDIYFREMKVTVEKCIPK